MSESLNILLNALADESRSVQAMDLTELSDLARSEMPVFRAAWDALSPARHLALMAALVEQAEANIHLNFHVILRTCLADGDAQVRRLAIEGLWEDDRVNLVQPLVDLLNNDPAADVRAAAATSLGRYMLLSVLGEIADAPARQVESALRAAWARFAEPVTVRRRALESLAYSDSPAIHEMIQGAYYDENDLMRQSAVFAMGRSADARWSRFVLSELHNHQAAMRFEAAAAAGEMGLRAAVQPLIGRLDDPDSSVRQAAATALGKIGGPAARRALGALLESNDEALALAAEDALDELSFSSQQIDMGSTDDDAVRSKRGRDADSDDEDGEFDGADALFGDPNDEFADLYEDEMLDGEDEFGLEPEDEEEALEWEEEGWEGKRR